MYVGRRSAFAPGQIGRQPCLCSRLEHNLKIVGILLDHRRHGLRGPGRVITQLVSVVGQQRLRVLRLGRDHLVHHLIGEFLAFGDGKALLLLAQ